MEKEKLITTANSLSKLLDLDPPINVDNSENQIIKEIRDCVCMLYPEDEFPPEVKETLKEIIRPKDIQLMMNASPQAIEAIDDTLTPDAVKIAAKRLVELGIGVEKQETKDKAPVGDYDDDLNKEELIDLIDNSDDLKDIKELCKVYEVFKSLRDGLTTYKDADTLKVEMVKILDAYNNKHKVHIQKVQTPSPYVKKQKVREGKGYREKDRSKANVFITKVFAQEIPMTYKEMEYDLLKYKVTNSIHSAHDTVMRCIRILRALNLVTQLEDGRFVKNFKSVNYYTKEEMQELQNKIEDK